MTHFKLLVAATAALLATAAPAWATSFVNTGTPTIHDDAAILDATDWLAASFTLSDDSLIQSVGSFVSGGTLGETYTVALYADTALTHKPGSLLGSVQAVFQADGWNTASTSWALAAGTYWVALEINAGDNLGSASVAGATLDHGTSAPLTRTAISDSFSGYTVTRQPVDFGLTVDGVVQTAAVPEPASVLLLVSGLFAVGGLARRQQRG